MRHVSSRRTVPMLVRRVIDASQTSTMTSGTVNGRKLTLPIELHPIAQSLTVPSMLMSEFNVIRKQTLQGSVLTSRWSVLCLD